MKLREYQEDAVNAIFEYFDSGSTGHPIVAMPTGTGKSLVIASFIQRVLKMYPSSKILKITHVKELISQNMDKLLRIWPTAPAGIYSAGLGRRDSKQQIIFAGISSVYSKADLFGHVDLILIDECHLVSPKSETMYQSFIKDLEKYNPALKVIGFTATPYRTGTGLLVEGGKLFTDVCIDMTTTESFNWFFDNGYLTRLIPRPAKELLDLSNVRTTGGDFNQQDLQLAVDKAHITSQALKEAIEIGSDREHWLIFASGVEHAIHIAEELNSMGIKATCVHSDMSKTERDENIQGFTHGKYKAMVNNGILTTGFDYPLIDFIIVLRPTKSAGLWVQMLGRGTRPVYEAGYDITTSAGRLEAIALGDKPNCLVLDFARNTVRLGPINDPILPKQKGSGNGEAPVRICESCGCYCHASLASCNVCGFVFPRHVKFNSSASSSVLIKEVEKPVLEDFKVTHITYTLHRKTGKPDSMQVTYYCGYHRFKEWVCLEHEGFVGHKARKWWRERTEFTAPDKVEDALSITGHLKIPKSIRVWVNKQYPEIVAHIFFEPLSEDVKKQLEDIPF